MGFKFRRTIKVAPGVRINIGKKGLSTSVGKRGAGITFGLKGTTAHVGIPGTGMSYTTKLNAKSKLKNEEKLKNNNENCTSNCGCYLLLFILFAFAWFVAIGIVTGNYGEEAGKKFIILSLAIPILLFIIFCIYSAISGMARDKRISKEIKERARKYILKDLDPYFNEASRLVVISQHCSISKLQLNLKIGQNRASHLIDQMESAGIVGPADGSESRDVLIKDEESLDKLLQNLKRIS